LETDSDRLLAEAVTYEQTIQQDETNTKGFQQIVNRTVKNALQCVEGEEVVASDPLQSPSQNSNDVQNSIEEAFMSEIESLERACQQHRDELAHIKTVQKEQALIYDEIERIADSTAAEQNALELESRAFDSDQEHLSKMLGEYRHEMECLSSSAIRLPAALVHVHVDIERGLRYPLINELRLAFRPKGDLHWKEIQGAWALASNLLLMVATVFNFQSQRWKIVPLSHCAKLIYSPPKNAEKALDVTVENRSTKEEKNQVIVFNIGHPKTNGSKALLMWNALLCQVIQHVVAKNSQAVDDGIYGSVDDPPVPFDISSTSIGGLSLAQLEENDDTEWSRVIHFMAANLLWLSKCASNYLMHRVILIAPLSNTMPEVQSAA
jgi:Apg6 BARA domain